MSQARVPFGKIPKFDGALITGQAKDSAILHLVSCTLENTFWPPAELIGLG